MADVERFIAALEKKRRDMLKEITETVVPYETYRDTVMRGDELKQVIEMANKTFKGDEGDERDRDG